MGVVAQWSITPGGQNGQTRLGPNGQEQWLLNGQWVDKATAVRAGLTFWGANPQSEGIQNGDKGTLNGQPVVWQDGQWVNASSPAANAGTTPPAPVSGAIVGTPPHGPVAGSSAITNAVLSQVGGNLSQQAATTAPGELPSIPASGAATTAWRGTPVGTVPTALSDLWDPPPTFDTSNQRTNAITQGLRAQADAAGNPRTVPTASMGAPAQASQASVPDLPRVGDISASQANGGQLQRVADVNASSAGSTALARAGDIDAAKAGGTSLARVNPITGATIDAAGDQQTRGQQEQLLSGLQAAANGAVPSAAEIQLRQTTDRNVANQLALASALQGHSVGGALKQASDASADINSQAAAASAILRAKEQADARAQLATTLSGVRSADQGLAVHQADLTQGTQVQNQNTAAGENALAFGTEADRQKFNAGLQQAAAVQNQNTAVGENTTQFTTEADRQKFNAGLQQAAALANQQTGLAENTTQLGADNAMAQFNANLRQAAAVQNQQAGITQNATQFNGAVDVAKLNATLGTDVSKLNLTETDRVALANQDAALTARGLDDKNKATILQAMLLANGQVIQGVDNAASINIRQQAADFALKQLAQAKSEADRAYWTNVVGSVLGAGASGLQTALTGGSSGGGADDSGGSPNVDTGSVAEQPVYSNGSTTTETSGVADGGT